MVIQNRKAFEVARIFLLINMYLSSRNDFHLFMNINKYCYTNSFFYIFKCLLLSLPCQLSLQHFLIIYSLSVGVISRGSAHLDVKAGIESIYYLT